MSQDKVFAQLKKDVRSLLISSKLGLEPQQLCQDYFQMLGHPMPLRMLGYRNIMHFINDMPDVVSVVVSPDRRLYLKAVCDDTTKDQAALVTKQRLSKADRNCQKRNSGCIPLLSRHTQLAPRVAFHGKFRSTFIPPDLRTQLHHLLSRGPIRLVELEWKYYKCFGFPLCVNHYGFQTKEEMLMAASDMITLQHDHLGSMLTLKQHLLLKPPLTPPSSTQRSGPLKPRFLPPGIPSKKELRAEVRTPVTGSVNDSTLKRWCSQKPVDLVLKNSTTIVLGEDFPLKPPAVINAVDLVDNVSDVFHMEPLGNNGSQTIISDSIDTKMDLNDIESFNDGVKFVQDCPVNPEEIEIPEMCHAMPVHLVPTVPADAVLNQRLKPPTRHNARELIEVSVEAVLSPGHFYIRFIFSDESSALEKMMIDMRRCYRCSEALELYCLPEQFVRQGQVCCLSPAGWWYYRAVIHQIVHSTEVEVYYVDFGIMATVHTNKLKFLKSSYSVLPAQGVPSSLAGITPIDGAWTAEALACFRELYFNRILVGLLDDYVGDVLQLYLCDTSTTEDIYSHHVLIHQGHGKACSTTVSAALSPTVTPASLYLREGMVDLPEIEVKKILTPQSWDSKEEEVDMPSLELMQ